MNIEFTQNGWKDLTYWIKTDKDSLTKIRELLKAIKQEPFKGLGKPEPLKFDLKCFWYRSISGEHRLVYEITATKGVNQMCTVIACRFRYQ